MIWTTDLVGSFDWDENVSLLQWLQCAYCLSKSTKVFVILQETCIHSPKHHTHYGPRSGFCILVCQQIHRETISHSQPKKRCVLSPRETSPLPRPSFMTKEITLGYFQLIYQVIMNVCIFSILNPKRKAPLLSLILLDFHLYVNK